MKINTTKSKANGHDLLNELQSAAADVLARADERHADVAGRLGELESEVTSLVAVKELARSIGA